MNNLLFVTSSLFGAHSQSRAVATGLVENWRQAHPGGHVVERNLTPETTPHLTAETLAAIATPAAQRSPEQIERTAFADALIEELEAADTIVIAAPMYNFSVSSTLRAWIDHIARAGRTFRYSETGPIGLLTGKKVFVVTARGGVFSTGPAQAMDHQEPYLRTVLGFLGLTDVTFIHAEGLAISPEAKAQGLARGHEAAAAYYQPIAA